MIFFFCGREDEDKRRQENGQTLILFKTALFGAWPTLLVHICLTPSEGPKGFVVFLRNQAIKIGPWKNTIFHGPTSWSMV